jgi:hypothetical protein
LPISIFLFLKLGDISGLSTKRKKDVMNSDIFGKIICFLFKWLPHAIWKKDISSVLMRFLCKTSHKDSCAWPCLTWHCQPIKSAEYNQWSPLLRLL